MFHRVPLSRIKSCSMLVTSPPAETTRDSPLTERAERPSQLKFVLPPEKLQRNCLSSRSMAEFSPDKYSLASVADFDNRKTCMRRRQQKDNLAAN